VYPHHGALLGAALHFDAAAMQFDDPAHQRQTQSTAGQPTGVLAAVQLIKDVGKSLQQE